MIIPDLNLLVYAYNSDAPDHEQSRRWWEDALNGRETVGVPWTVCLGFLRLMMNRHVLRKPWSGPDVVRTVRGWFEQTQVQVLQPGPRHLEILQGYADTHLLTSDLTTDAHLAALAVEHQATVCSNDADFGRFGVSWRNPLTRR